MSAPDVGIGIGTGNVTPVAPEQHPVDYRRVYVWELPVRVYHWINAVALVGLCITGYLIGRPIMAFYAPEAYQQYEKHNEQRPSNSHLPVTITKKVNDRLP